MSIESVIAQDVPQVRRSMLGLLQSWSTAASTIQKLDCAGSLWYHPCSALDRAAEAAKARLASLGTGNMESFRMRFAAVCNLSFSLLLHERLTEPWR